MICRTCHRSVPDGMLACPSCTRQQSDRAYMQYQDEPLRRVLAGLGRLTLRRGEGLTWHVQMFGCEEAFCGEALKSRKAERVELGELTPKACAKCRERLAWAIERCQERISA